MAETAKFRKEEMPTGWDAAKQSFRQSPAAAPLRAGTNLVANVLSVPGAIMKAGEEAGRNFNFAQGSTGGLMPPAARSETERVRQELNPNGAGVLVNALPRLATAAAEAPQNFRAAVTNQPTYPEARPYTPDMSLTPRTTTAPQPTMRVPANPGELQPMAVDYGRGITEIVGAPGQQGRSFTNLIPAGAPATGITEMTRRFRNDPQGAVSDSGEVLLGQGGRGSFRTETTAPAPAEAPAATGLRQPKSIEDYLSGVRATGGPGDVVALGLASRLSANDVAMANRDENLAARGIRQQQTDRKLGIDETNAETARRSMRTAQAKALADLEKPEAMRKVKFAPPAPDPNGMPVKDAEGNITYPMLPAKVTLGDTEFDVSAEDYAYAREEADKLAAIHLKKNPSLAPELAINESLQAALAKVIRLRNASPE